jgi:hypothetical protein
MFMQTREYLLQQSNVTELVYELQNHEEAISTNKPTSPQELNKGGNANELLSLGFGASAEFHLTN